MLRGHRLAAIDGHEINAGYRRCCLDCQTRQVTVNGEPRAQYYRQAVAFLLVGPDFHFLLDVELLHPHDDEGSAALRLIHRVLHAHPRCFDRGHDGIAVENFAIATELAGPWTVSFPPGRQAPARIELPELTCWTRHADPGVKHFSGTARYEKTFRLDAAQRADLKDGADFARAATIASYPGSCPAMASPLTIAPLRPAEALRADARETRDRRPGLTSSTAGSTP